ncbi:MAG TPA: right-handed parallel beta-helix repeat-containing protein, partial [Thermoanaerobaculia bacterium]|nr:right-handed parallel beta-helix repeat-containing protein [Thermoanaerobaculia bacterium]
MRLHAAVFAFSLSLLSAGLAAAQGRPVRVPQDAKTLEAAISRVADGGVIEMAAGIYPSPPKGFLIGDLRKGFTIRAAGGPVVLDGGGTRPVLRFVNFNRSRGRLVTFEGITFRNGASVAPNVSGGVTLEKAEAVFRNCAFEGNTANAPSTGGGGAKVFAGSTATFIGCRWEGNWSKNRGGALVVRDSEVTVQGGAFVNNRTNLPGHNPGSPGGAVYVLGGTLRVSGVRFERNEAGWTGGAIYAFGHWEGPGAQVEVTRSTFVENQAVADPCCVNAEATSGGAIHVENLASLTVHQSRFVRNRADWGAGIDSFRGFVEVHGSVFQGNQTTAVKPDGGIGGAIAVFSNDGTGDANHRSSRLTVTRSFLEGGSGIERAALAGGCIFAAGDSNRAYGENGVAPLGTLDENRARVTLRHVVLSDCDVEADADHPGFGGGLMADFVDLTMEDSMVLGSDARGEGSGGGGLAIREESVARIARTTFAGNSAERWGGALFLSGSDVDLRDSRFFGNDVVPGVFEPINQSRGAAIFTIPRTNPARPRNVAGVVAGSVFAENLGLPVWDLDPPDGPINDVRYDGNRFDSGTFGDRVYVNSLAAPSGASVSALNSLFVNRPGRVSTPKSAVPNARVSNPREGALVAVPAPESVGADPTSPQGTHLAYAWSGRSAGLAGQALPGKSGLLPVA